MRLAHGLNLKEWEMTLTHKNVSFVKSLVRIGAGAALMLAGNEMLLIAGICIAVAELLGILEELV